MTQERYDVIVAGFGTAGANAAIAASRQHASVLVLEPNTYPGGTLTGGGVPGFYGRHPYGLTAEIDQATQAYMKIHSCTNIEARKAILESEALANGCHIIYEAVIYAVKLDGKAVKGVSWADADGIHTATCGMLIDASAEGRACALAKCPFILGRDTDGRCNIYTNSMILGNGDGAYVNNFDAGRINQYDAQDYSCMIQKSFLLHLKDDYTFKHDEPHQLVPADLPGIREGRHLITEEFLNLDDFFAGKYNCSQEIIGYAHSNLDTHANDMPLENRTFKDWMLAASMWGTEIWFPITRGVLIPKGYTGLLLAGRHIGVSHDYGQAVRMNDHMGRVGEAAGILAALAKDGDALSVPMSELTSRLEELPCPLKENDSFTSLSLEEIRNGLASDKPGFAIWSARTQHISKELKCWMENAEPGSELKRHAAFALALLDDDSAVPELLKMAAERDSYTPCTSRKYNHERGYAAVYLLGRLAAPEAVPVIIGILDDNAIEKKYEYYSNAIAALISIGNAHPETKKAIEDKFKSILADKDWALMSRRKGTQEYYRIDGIFREQMQLFIGKN